MIIVNYAKYLKGDINVPVAYGLESPFADARKG